MPRGGGAADDELAACSYAPRDPDPRVRAPSRATSTSRLITHVAGDVTTSTTAWMSAIVALEDRVERELAEAGDDEDLLGDDGAGDQDAELQADDRDHGRSGCCAARGARSPTRSGSPLARAVRT